MAGPPPLVTLHLHGVHGAAMARALVRMALDRRHLARTPGLRFWKLLGTGDGETFSVRDADPTRWGLFAVWDEAAAADRFESASTVSRAWRSLADEHWRCDLRPLRWHGRWSGREPFAAWDPVAGQGPGLGGGGGADGRVAALTRARVRPRHWRRFAASVPPVAAAAREAPGLRFSTGIGEAPIGLQATFSIWDDEDSIDAFAYRGSQHRDVIRTTRATGWYAEELFARFAVLRTTGTVGGREV